MTDKPTIEHTAAQDEEAVAFSVSHFGEEVTNYDNESGCVIGADTGRVIAEFSHRSEAESAIEYWNSVNKSVEALRAELSAKVAAFTIAKNVADDRRKRIKDLEQQLAASQQRVRELEGGNVDDFMKPPRPKHFWTDENEDTMGRLCTGLATDGDQMLAYNQLRECDIYEDVYVQLCDIIEPHVIRDGKKGFLPASVVDSMQMLLDAHLAAPVQAASAERVAECPHVEKRDCSVCGKYLGWRDLADPGRLPTDAEWRQACRDSQASHDAAIAKQEDKPC